MLTLVLPEKLGFQLNVRSLEKMRTTVGRTQFNENAQLQAIQEKTKVVSQSSVNNGRTAFQDISNQNRPQQTALPTQKAAILAKLQSIPQPNLPAPQQPKEVALPVIHEPENNHMELIYPEEEKGDDETLKQNKRRGSDSRPPIRHSLRQSKRRKSEEMDLLIPEENSPKKPTWEDIDVNDGGDPSMVSEYVNDIYAYLSGIEVHT
jgi:G2/mitotic-specific cyclin 1/2